MLFRSRTVVRQPSLFPRSRMAARPHATEEQSDLLPENITDTREKAAYAKTLSEGEESVSYTDVSPYKHELPNIPFSRTNSFITW